MGKLLDIAGERYNFLVAEERAGRNARGQILWRFRCDCGGETVALVGMVRTGKHKSCSCGLGRLSHGKRYTRIYSVWQSIKYRCYNPKHPSYHRYGGRGIALCDEWQKFEAFEAWATQNGYADDLQIDRTNNDGGYEPENCRFVTPAENMRNRSCSKRPA